MVTVEVSRHRPRPWRPRLHGLHSYAKVKENEDVKKQVDAVAKPIEQNYQSLIRQLHDRNAVGVVVAVNGRIIWADVFASTDLLEKYWPKLVRSYASEAVVTRAKEVDVTVSRARLSWQTWKAAARRSKPSPESIAIPKSTAMASRLFR